MAFRTSNPILKDKNFRDAEFTTSKRMTINGTLNKALLMLLLLSVTASFVWHKATSGDLGTVTSLMFLGMIGSLGFILYTVFTKKINAVTSLGYAAFEGLMIGGLSAILNMSYPGIVMQAVTITFGIAFGMFAMYRYGIIKVTDKFRMGVMGATGGIFVIYMLNMVLGMFGIQVPFIHSTGMFGIGFSVFVIGIASLNLVLDFDFIDRATKNGASEEMEWMGAFGLMVTLIWLYVEVLRLLSLLNRR
ncbi:MAG: Bax inhibitor-1/YccA family protein [Candidatus Cloacimonadota bacterium]|nr:Bax inhibitor-1/YccA family protein [Candidatus Cloacimonadota bacterium]